MSIKEFGIKKVSDRKSFGYGNGKFWYRKQVSVSFRFLVSPLTGLRRQRQSLSITHNMSPGRGWNFQQKKLHFHCKIFFFFKNFAQIIVDICTSKNISANIYVRNFFNSKYCRIFCGILSTANIFGNICVKNTIKNAVFFNSKYYRIFCGN